VATYQKLKTAFQGTPYTDEITIRIDGKYRRFTQNDPVELARKEYDQIPKEWLQFFTKEVVNKEAISGIEE